VRRRLAARSHTSQQLSTADGVACDTEAVAAEAEGSLSASSSSLVDASWRGFRVAVWNLKPMPLRPNYGSIRGFHTGSSRRITLIFDIFRIGVVTGYRGGLLNLYSVYSASNVRRLCALLCPAISFLHFHVLHFSRPSFSRPAFSAPPPLLMWHTGNLEQMIPTEVRLHTLKDKKA